MVEREDLKSLLVGAGLLALVVGGCAAMVEPFGYGPVDPRPSSTPSPTLDFIDWSLDRRTCADGWPSMSIGRPGACSHHGGVVSVWTSPEGFEARCPDGGAPVFVTEEAAEEQLAEYGRILC